MKLLDLNRRDKYVKLRVDNEDDLWDLYNILYKGDKVVARTTREMKDGDSSKRKGMTLEIVTEWAELQPMTNRLRVHGKISNCPRDLDIMGKHHTLSVSNGDMIELYKEDSWLEIDIKRLKESERRVNTVVMVCAVDSEDFAIAQLMNFGLKMLEIVSLDLHLKGQPDQEVNYRENKIDSISKDIIQISKKLNPSLIIIAGPSFLKEELKKHIKSVDPSLNLKLMDTSYGGIKGIYESIRKGAAEDLVKEFNIVQEDSLMEEFNRRLAKEGKISYGLFNIENIAKMGVIETLVVSNELLKSPDLEQRKKLIATMEEVEKHGGRVKIFMAEYNTKTWLRSLGGIAAFLRYNI